MSKREEILEKIRKLQAHADSAGAIGNEAEAQAFAAKVQDLLTAYKLSQADVTRSDQPAEEPINVTQVRWSDLGLKDRSVRIGWAEQLAKFVADAYYCSFIVQTWPRGNIGMFCGAETDRKIATYMYATLGRFLYNLAEREDRKYKYQAWVEAGKPSSGAAPNAHGFKAGFIFGFITRLKERFDEEVKPKATVAASTTQAIVLVRKNSLDRVRRWMGDNMNLRSIRSTSMNDGSCEGKQAGKAAANNVNLKPNAVNSGANRKELK